MHLTEIYKKIVIAEVANVSCAQMQEVRRDLRGKAIILMGKNTLMKKTFTLHAKDNPKLQVLIPYLKGTIGLIFTNDDLRVIRDIVNLKKRRTCKSWNFSTM